MAENAPNQAPREHARPLASRAAAAYAAIEAALTQHARGRWFLAEYARRNRTADTQMLLEAIIKLEAAVLRPQRQQQQESGTVLSELVAMSEAIARTRREISQITPPHKLDAHLTNATEELDHVVEATETATSEILQAAEEVQEVAWILREKGTDVQLCDTLDQRATDIYTACSFQDITGQRTAKVVQALRFIEQRINAMIEIWGVDDIAARLAALEQKAVVEQPLLSGPQGKKSALKQDDIDAMLAGAAKLQGEAVAGPPSPQTAPGAAPALRSEVAASGFEAPEPLTLARLHAVKRAALFG
jgi:chemotaxis protein CheZ